MRPSIGIPEAQAIEAPALLRLVRMAPTYDVETTNDGASYVALFHDFPTSSKTVMTPIDQVWDLRDIRTTLEESIIHQADISEASGCQLITRRRAVLLDT